MASRIQRPETAFPLSTGFKRPRKKNDAHLKFVRLLPCLCAGSECSGDVEAAHIRYASSNHGKPAAGAGEKPSDCYTVPLCHRHHNDGPDSQHAANEARWWQARGVDPVVIAALLFCTSGDEEAGRHVCFNARRVAPWPAGR